VGRVEVVSLCDVDKRMLAGAAELNGRPPGLEEDAGAPTATDHEMLKEKDLNVGAGGHAGFIGARAGP